MSIMSCQFNERTIIFKVIRFASSFSKFDCSLFDSSKKRQEHFNNVDDSNAKKDYNDESSHNNSNHDETQTTRTLVPLMQHGTKMYNLLSMPW